MVLVLLLFLQQEHITLFFKPDLNTKWGADGKIGATENKDAILDFYHFLTSEPGTEFDLILDCGIQQCKAIEDMIEFNKGLYIQPTTDVWRSNIKVEWHNEYEIILKTTYLIASVIICEW